MAESKLVTESGGGAKPGRVQASRCATGVLPAGRLFVTFTCYTTPLQVRIEVKSNQRSRTCKSESNKKGRLSYQSSIHAFAKNCTELKTQTRTHKPLKAIKTGTIVLCIAMLHGLHVDG